MPTPTSHRFTKSIELDRDQLHALLQGVADRAYQQGHADGLAGEPVTLAKVQIPERSLCKISPQKERFKS